MNYHGYAACCRGAYYRRHQDIPDSVEGVLVLLRKSGLGDALQAIRSLRKRGKRVGVSWKESGLLQVARALERIGDNAVDIGEQVAFVVTGLFREFSDASRV